MSSSLVKSILQGIGAQSTQFADDFARLMTTYGDDIAVRLGNTDELNAFLAQNADGISAAGISDDALRAIQGRLTDIGPHLARVDDLASSFIGSGGDDFGAFLARNNQPDYIVRAVNNLALSTEDVALLANARLATPTPLRIAAAGADDTAAGADDAARAAADDTAGFTDDALRGAAQTPQRFGTADELTAWLREQTAAEVQRRSTTLGPLRLRTVEIQDSFEAGLLAEARLRAPQLMNQATVGGLVDDAIAVANRGSLATRFTSSAATTTAAHFRNPLNFVRTPFNIATSPVRRPFLVGAPLVGADYVTGNGLDWTASYINTPINVAQWAVGSESEVPTTVVEQILADGDPLAAARTVLTGTPTEDGGTTGGALSTLTGEGGMGDGLGGMFNNIASGLAEMGIPAGFAPVIAGFAAFMAMKFIAGQVLNRVGMGGGIVGMGATLASGLLAFNLATGSDVAAAAPQAPSFANSAFATPSV